MKNLSVFEIATSGWKEENFRLMTNLTEEQVRGVIQPMVDKEREDEIVLMNDEYVQALQDKYRTKIVVLYVDFELLELEKLKTKQMKISVSIKKDGFKLTILPTIQYYYAYRSVVIVWLNYELQFHIR